MEILLLLFGLMLAFGLAGFGNGSNADADEDDDGDLDETGDDATGVELIGTEGDDTLTGTEGNDTLRGVDGDNLLIGLDGDDLLIGGPGNDTLDGGPGTNTLLGGEGDDVLILSQPFGMGSVFDGGPGTDRLDASEFGQRLSLLIGPGDGQIAYDVPNPDEPTDLVQEIGILRDIEILDLPDAQGNYIEFAPNAPAVQVNGGDGGSSFWEIAAAHTLTGGAGNDEFNVTDFAPGLLIDGGGGSNLLEGELADGSTILFDTDGTAQVRFFDFNLGLVPIARIENIDDWLLFSENSLINATNTDIDLRIEMGTGTQNEVFGGSGDDVLIGNGFLFGGDGNDTISGSGTLLGGAGDDVLIGRGVIDGGSGDDVLITQMVLGMEEPGTTLTGGEGADLFDVRLTYLSGAAGGPTDPIRITDFSDDDQLELTIFYDSQEGFPSDPPELDFVPDAESDALLVQLNGDTVMIMNGIDALPDDALTLRFVPFDIEQQGVPGLNNNFIL